jgi:hypothetical protein
VITQKRRLHEPAGAVPLSQAPFTLPAPFTLLSEDEEARMSTPDAIACREALKQGKAYLKESNGPAAMVRFEKALMLSKAAGDKIRERRCAYSAHHCLLAPTLALPLQAWKILCGICWEKRHRVCPGVCC